MFADKRNDSFVNRAKHFNMANGPRRDRALNYNYYLRVLQKG